MLYLVWSDLTLANLDNASRVPNKAWIISKANQNSWRDYYWQGVYFSQFRQMIQRLNAWKDGCLTVVQSLKAQNLFLLLQTELLIELFRAAIFRDFPRHMKELGLSVNIAGTSGVRPRYQLPEFLGSSHNDSLYLLLSEFELPPHYILELFFSEGLLNLESLSLPLQAHRSELFNQAGNHQLLIEGETDLR